jgi:hypothetical protein
MYNTNPEFKAAFDQEVKDAINIEIIEKYKWWDDVRYIINFRTKSKHYKSY